VSHQEEEEITFKSEFTDFVVPLRVRQSLTKQAANKAAGQHTAHSTAPQHSTHLTATATQGESSRRRRKLHLSQNSPTLSYRCGYDKV
jgi:hypothetical protein